MAAGRRLVSDLDLMKLEAICHEVSLEAAIDCAYWLLSGEIQGRTIVNFAEARGGRDALGIS
jgi:hypothetical protein